MTNNSVLADYGFENYGTIDCMLDHSTFPVFVHSPDTRSYPLGRLD